MPACKVVMPLIVRESLKWQTSCPVCGASWLTLEGMLHNPGEERDTAIMVIENCHVCKERFEEVHP